jgi:hypothetical protein
LGVFHIENNHQLKKKFGAFTKMGVHTDEEEKDKLTTKRQKKTHFKRQKKGINILLLF